MDGIIPSKSTMQREMARHGRVPATARPSGSPQPQIVPPPPAEPGGGRWFFRILFWGALAICLELWWLNTPANSVNSTGTVLVAAGRIIGMVGGFILLVQILLMSRLGWVERWIGAQEVLIWHRELGSSLLVVVLAHVFLSIFGYAASDGSSAVHETWAMATLYEDMASAFIATGLLVAISVLSIRLLRRIMPYEVWYYTHLTSYLVLLLS